MRIITRPIRKAKIPPLHNKKKWKYKQSSFGSSGPVTTVKGYYIPNYSYVINDNGVITAPPKSPYFKEVRDKQMIFDICTYTLYVEDISEEQLCVKTPELYKTYKVYCESHGIGLIPNNSLLTIIDFDHTAHDEEVFDFKSILEYNNEQYIRYGRALAYGVCFYCLPPF